MLPCQLVNVPPTVRPGNKAAVLMTACLTFPSRPVPLCWSEHRHRCETAETSQENGTGPAAEGTGMGQRGRQGVPGSALLVPEEWH